MNDARLTNLLLVGILLLLVWDTAKHKPRFQPTGGSDAVIALDTYTGRACIGLTTKDPSKAAIPFCWEIK